MQSMSENDFECFASTGGNPLGTMPSELTLVLHHTGSSYRPGSAYGGQYPCMMSVSSAVKAAGFRRIARVLHLHRHCHTESLPHCLGSILIVRSFVKGELQ